MKWQDLTIEKAIYGLIFIVALGLRLLQVGSMPLNDVEAGYALQSLAQAQGESGTSGAQPGYLALTTLLFYQFGSGAVLARFVPALAGSLLVFAPFLFKKSIGSKVALLIAGLLAIDPVGLALSRQANGTMLAVSGLLLAAGCFYSGHHKSGGFWLGIGLLGGASTWLGLVIAIFTGLIYQFVAAEGSEKAIPASIKDGWKEILVFTTGTMILVSSLFFLVPGGLAAFGGSLVEFINGFGIKDGQSFWPIILMLAIYYPLGLLLGLWQGGRNIFEKETINTIALIWIGVSLVVIGIYPARQMSDIVWISIPLWVLAARRLIILAATLRREWTNILGQGILVTVLLGFIWLNIVAYSAGRDFSGEPENRLIAAAIAFILVTGLTVLVAWGWSRRVAGFGLILGIGIILSIYSFGASIRSAGLGRLPCNEPWLQAACFSEEKQVIKTLEEVSEWNVNSRTGVDILLVDINSNALRWALRNFTNVTEEKSISTLTQPMTIITNGNVESEMPGQYVGQDFVLSESPDWQTVFANRLMRWISHREASSGEQLITLWVRNDMFPGVK